MKDFSFEHAAGSITGRDHLGRYPLLLGRNNQDAFDIQGFEQGLVAIVSDGCGSKPHSEVGAKWAVKTLSNRIRDLHQRYIKAGIDPDKRFWSRIQNDFLAQLRVKVLEMTGSSGSFSKILEDYFLFTILGVLVGPERSFVFSVGDGIYALNGEIKIIKPEHGNKPPYIAYGLVESEFSSKPELLNICIREDHLTRDISSLVIGTDGLEALINAEEKTLPASPTLVGPFNQFWESDLYFQNQDALRRKLALMNREVLLMNSEGTYLQTDYGLLPDDTTIVSIRKRPKEDEDECQS